MKQISGGERKQNYLVDDLKLDGSIDYKSTKKTVSEQLDEYAPNGVDFIYDNGMCCLHRFHIPLHLGTTDLLTLSFCSFPFLYQIISRWTNIG